ncbi:sensor domain-containing protein [Streptomyces sp. DSM 42041]|uniref:histidine kinase n=1 Tax=Streptomyces hazeniae TaxID=3075538 RepID=A0ABU2NRK4_9ACTN|nr:sensor domain-containing protein [Streptomyces sp. DSM 42041]MDT0379605.1 sensor domain-containing protein [Streptomyces sp. DSM 42041]
MVATVRAFALCLLSLGVSLALFIVTVVSLAFLLLGVGFLTTPAVLTLVRMHANQRRALAHDWAGLTIPAPYRAFPPTRRGGPAGQVERCTLLLRDPATWRDVLWLLVDAVAGFVTALLPVALIGYGVEGLVLLAGLWHAVSGAYWYAFIPVSGFGSAVLCAALGTALIALGLVANPALLRAHFLLARALLAPTREARLEQRVRRLAETRHDAVDDSAAALRRIERDLHDGAQARLVAMGMDLGTALALIEKDPAGAKALLAQARSSSAAALTELRDLVRGIHPPVLAERGLADAAEALALRCGVPVETDIDLPGRYGEPVEAAAYFAISEVLTNAARHAGARRVWLDLHFAPAPGGGGALRVAVTDDGRGGADPSAGSGLRGVERRLAGFDGVLAVSSPPGGPTMVTMEVPAAPAAEPVSSPSGPRR